MKYYLLRGTESSGIQQFNLVRVRSGDIPSFLKRQADQVLFEGNNVAEVLLQLGGMLDKTGKNMGNHEWQEEETNADRYSGG